MRVPTPHPAEGASLIERVAKGMRNIVVALDGSEPARLALGWAQELAKTSDAPLFHLVHTCQMPLAAIEAGGGSLVSSEYQQEGSA